MQSNYSNLHSAKLAIKAWLNPPRSLQPRLSSLSPCKSKMVSWKLSLGMPAKATATLWPSSKQPPGVESTSCNAATLRPPPSHCESSRFPPGCVRRGMSEEWFTQSISGCQQRDESPPGAASPPSHQIQRGWSLSLTQLTGGEIKPILRNPDSPDLGSIQTCIMLLQRWILQSIASQCEI